MAALRKMFVHKNYRGKEKGIAKKLLTVLLEWAAQKQINAIYLGTHETLVSAQRFYEKNNFQKIDKSKLPPQFPIMKADSVFFEFIL